jgi:hypothetical protein
MFFKKKVFRNEKLGEENTKFSLVCEAKKRRRKRTHKKTQLKTKKRSGKRSRTEMQLKKNRNIASYGSERTEELEQLEKKCSLATD